MSKAMANGSRKGFNRNPLWMALVLLVLSLLMTLVWLAGRYELEKLQIQTNRDASDGVSDLRAGLNRNLHALESMIPISGSPTQWARHTEASMRERAEWLRIEWRNGQMELVTAANSPTHNPRQMELISQRLLPEVQWACAQARRDSMATYTPSVFVTQEHGVVGTEVMEMCVPWSKDGQLRGHLVVTYSLSGLLSSLVSPSLYRSQRLSFVDADGNRLAMIGQIRDGKRMFNSQHMLSLPGASLMLRVDSRRMGPDVFTNLLTAAVAALSLGLLTVLALLARDTRRRHRAEQELAAALTFRTAMENSLVTGLRARDMEGRITYVNPAFCDMVGWPAGALLGSKHPPPYWPPEMISEYGQRQALRLAGAATPRIGVESVFMHANGERFPVLIFEAPLIDAQGQQAGWMSAILDVSEQRRIEEISRSSQEKLQATARLASLGEMASLLSHELNQPLVAISSYAHGSLNLLKSQQGSMTELDQQLHEAVQRIAQQAERAGQVIQSVHDFVRRRSPTREPVNPNDLVDSVLPLLKLQAQKWAIDLKIDVPKHLPEIHCDRAMVEQVILNLARNGMQAMGEPPETRGSSRILSICMRELRTAQGPASLIVEVTDWGCGIDPEAEINLYTPFFTTKQDGMGLGLSLCRTVVEQHGGQLSHRPHSPHGTVFVFNLPYRGMPITSEV
jgi:two-component system sensor histidine kinase DctS